MVPIPLEHLDGAISTLALLAPEGGARLPQTRLDSGTANRYAHYLRNADNEDSVFDDATEGHLAHLRGLTDVPIELRTKHEILRGRIVEVLEAGESLLEECGDVNNSETGVGCHKPPQASVLFVTDSQALRRVDIVDVVSVGPSTASAHQRFEVLFGGPSPKRGSEMASIRIERTKNASVSVGYYAQTSPWRATYRLTRTGAPRANLSGAALVKNDSDEEYRNLSVDFVMGGQPLPAGPLCLGLPRTPTDGTCDPVIGNENSSDAGSSSVFSVLVPVVLPPHDSALIPFLETEVQVEEVTWLSALNHQGENGLITTNPTSQVLPPGNVAIYGKGGLEGAVDFAGLNPRAVGVLAWGTDEKVAVRTVNRTERIVVRDVTFDESELREAVWHIEETDYELSSTWDVPRLVAINSDTGTSTYGLDGFITFDISQARGSRLGLVRLPPHGQRKFSVHVERSKGNRVAPSELSVTILEDLVAHMEIPEKRRKILGDVLTWKRRLEGERERCAEAANALVGLDAEISEVRTDLAASRSRDTDATSELSQRLLSLGKERGRHNATTTDCNGAKERAERAINEALARLSPKPEEE